jgi:hypothetical protein
MLSHDSLRFFFWPRKKTTQQQQQPKKFLVKILASKLFFLVPFPVSTKREKENLKIKWGLLKPTILLSSLSYWQSGITQQGYR